MVNTSVAGAPDYAEVISDQDRALGFLTIDLVGDATGIT